MLPAFEDLDARIVLYAVASLTVVRMVPVAIALVGSGQDRTTAAFIGWFGPRGLASVVFALLAVEELGNTDPRVETAVNTIAVTIVFSIVAHGVTARPLATRYVGALQHTPRRAAGSRRGRTARRAGHAVAATQLTARLVTTSHPVAAHARAERRPSTPC